MSLNPENNFISIIGNVENEDGTDSPPTIMLLNVSEILTSSPA